VKRARISWDAVKGDLAALSGDRPDAEVARRLGERMRRFLDALDWGGHEEALVRGRWKGGELRLVVRSAAAELYSLPWELVTLEGSGRHLADVPECTLRYEWPREREEEARPGAAEEGRVLFAWSEAGGGVSDDKHLMALTKACWEGGLAFDPERDVLKTVSLGSLEKRLREARQEKAPVSVLHLLCHGAPLETSRPGHHGLALNGPEASGSNALVDGVALGAVLAPYVDTLKMVVLCACHGGDGGSLASHLGSVAQELHRAGIEMVVASRLPLSMEGSGLLAETLYEKLLVDSCSLEEALGAVRRRLRVEAKGFDWASLQLYARREGEADLRPVVLRPYRGLLAFGPKDRRFFFGRSRLEAELLERVGQAARGQRPRFQVVAGASGAGKSSVVMAGLVPQLPREEWDVVVVKPGELVSARAGAAGASSVALRELQHRLHRLGNFEPLPEAEGASQQELVEEVRRLRQARPEHKLLLVVDQLEEVFTQLGREERQALMRAVWALGQEPELGCVVVATMRVDHFERCGEVVLDERTRLDTVVYTEEHRLFVAQMGPEELAEAIEKPARVVGLELEAGLVDRLVSDVGHEPGALPLLGHALDLLWRRREGRKLTHQAYEELGGVAGSLTQTAERLYGALREEERQQVRRLLAELVSLGDETRPDSRRRCWLEEVWPEEPEARASFERVLEKLVTERLVIRGREAGGTGKAWVEVAHEALIRRWERLRTWLQENRKRLLQWRELQAMAEAWQGHRKDADKGDSYLATGARLGYARSIRSEHVGQLTASVREFLGACEAREQRRVRRQRWVGAGLTVGMVVFAALSLYAFNQRSTAEDRLWRAVGLAREIQSITWNKLEPIAGTGPVRKELLQEVEKLLVSLDASNDPGVLLESVKNHIQGGEVAEKHENTERAIQEYNQALGILMRLLASHPEDAVYKKHLGDIRTRLGNIARSRGKLEEARGHYEKVLELTAELLDADAEGFGLQNLLISAGGLGEVMQAQGQLTEAHGHYEKLLHLLQKLLENGLASSTMNRNMAVINARLGQVALAQGRLSEAREYREEVLRLIRELSEAEPMDATLKLDLSQAHGYLGEVAFRQGRLTEAREHYEQKLGLCQELMGVDPTNVSLRQILLEAHGDLGEVMLAQGLLPEAREHYEQRLGLSLELLKADPANTSLKSELASSYDALGDVTRAQGQLAESRAYHEKALTLSQELSRAEPTNTSWKQNLADAHGEIAEVALAQGQLAEARAHFERKLESFQELLRVGLTDTSVKFHLARSYNSMGDVTRAQGQLEEAVQYYDKGLWMLHDLLVVHPDDVNLKLNLATRYGTRGELAQQQGQLAEARDYYGLALALFQELSEADSTHTRVAQSMTVIQCKLGQVAQAQGRFKEARGYYEKALGAFQALSQASPADTTLMGFVAATYGILGELAQTQRQLAEARANYEKALGIARKLFQANPTDFSLKWNLAVSYIRLGELAQARGQLAEAREYQQAAARLRQ
jgi:tetratricopeptide (TPR) repeat protein/DNA-binding MarR family transcriptional regulator